MQHIYLVTLDGLTILASRTTDGGIDNLEAEAVAMRTEFNVPSIAWVFNSGVHTTVPSPWSYIHWWIGEKITNVTYKNINGNISEVPKVLRALHLIGA